MKKMRPGLVRTRLLRWYEENRRDLPWRRTRDPYRIWVSEVMLQQTRVETVIDYYHRFVARFPDIPALARARQQSVLKAWEGLGYYARARNLHRATGLVDEAHGGVLPDDFVYFRSLPGVGDYIAAAVFSIAFDHPRPVIDGNVKRVLARLFCLDAPSNTSQLHPVFRERAEQLFDPAHPGAFNQAVMELGALVCAPTKPRCPVCPVRDHCTAAAAGKVSEYPQRVVKKRVPTHRIAVGVIYKGRQVLITRRKPEGLLGGLWEFPGGKLQNRESARAACVREIAEEVGLKVRILDKLTRVRHAYTHFKIEMDVFECIPVSGRVRLNEPVDFRWVPVSRLSRYPFPRANLKFIPELKPQLAI